MSNNRKTDWLIAILLLIISGLVSYTYYIVTILEVKVNLIEEKQVNIMKGVDQRLEVSQETTIEVISPKDGVAYCYEEPLPISWKSPSSNVDTFNVYVQTKDRSARTITEVFAYRDSESESDTYEYMWDLSVQGNLGKSEKIPFEKDRLYEIFVYGTDNDAVGWKNTQAVASDKFIFVDCYPK